VIVRTYWAWETTATLRLFGGALGAGAPTGGGEGGDKSCRHAHSLAVWAGVMVHFRYYKNEVVLGWPGAVWAGVMVHFRYYKNEVVLGWPGAAHALIGVNWFESVFHATTDFCKIHTDRSRFGNGGRKTVFRSSFGARPCQCMGMTVNNYMMSHKKRSCRTSSSLSLYRLT